MRRILTPSRIADNGAFGEFNDAVGDSGIFFFVRDHDDRLSFAVDGEKSIEHDARRFTVQIRRWFVGSSAKIILGLCPMARARRYARRHGAPHLA